MNTKSVTIKLEYGDLHFQMAHLINAADGDPTNDILIPIQIPDFTSPTMIPYQFEKGKTHALGFIANGRAGSKLTVSIEEIGVKEIMTTDHRGYLKDIIPFNVY